MLLPLTQEQVNPTELSEQDKLPLLISCSFDEELSADQQTDVFLSVENMLKPGGPVVPGKVPNALTKVH